MKPGARRRSVADLHNRLIYLLQELEPWEQKLAALQKKALIKMKKEQETYIEEPDQEEVCVLQIFDMIFSLVQLPFGNKNSNFTTKSFIRQSDVTFWNKVQYMYRNFIDKVQCLKMPVDIVI
jgi:hypothetical protein